MELENVQETSQEAMQEFFIDKDTMDFLKKKWDASSDNTKPKDFKSSSISTSSTFSYKGGR